MNIIYLVKSGKSFLFPCKTKTVGAFDTYDEAEKWININIGRYGTHMYIEPVEKLSKKELDDIFRTHTIVNIK